MFRLGKAIIAWLYDESVNMISGPLSVGVGDSISLLGIDYSVSNPSEVSVVTQAIQDDYQSRIFLPYRRGFSALVNPEGKTITPEITSDKGWGCVARSMQMAVAQGLVTLALGRDFRKSTATSEQLEIYRQIAFLFADRLDAPLSIQNFSRYGQYAFDQRPNGWFAPQTASYSASELWKEKFGDKDKNLEGNKWNPSSIEILQISDGDNSLYETIEKSIQAHPEGGTLLLLDHYLGGISDQVIHDSIIFMFSTSKLFQGFVGGALYRGYYFVGADNHKLYFMDPHETRDAIVREDQLANLEIVTNRSPNRLRWYRLASSISFVFALKNMADVEEFKAMMKTIPLFSTYDSNQIIVQEINMEDQLPIVEIKNQEVPLGQQEIVVI